MVIGKARFYKQVGGNTDGVAIKPTMLNAAVKKVPNPKLGESKKVPTSFSDTSIEYPHHKMHAHHAYGL